MGLLRSAGAVGLELDKGVIRVIELKGSKQTPLLAAADQVVIPEKAVNEGTFTDSEVMSNALTKLWAKAGISSRNVVLGISNQGLLIRMANFPKVPEKKLKRLLHLQAGEYFPIPLAQLVFDFSVVGEISGENSPELEILLVAAKREPLHKCLNALIAASLKPIIIDAPPLALMRTLTDDQLAGTVVLANISKELCTLLLVADSIPRFARVIPQTLQNYARETDLSLPEIPDAAQQVAASTIENVPAPGNDAILEWGVMLAGEIRSSIGYYLTRHNGNMVDKFIVSGCGSRVTGLPGLLQKELEVPVEIINPLAKFKGLSRSLGVDMEQTGPDFSVSIGLALRGLEV